MNHRKKDDKYFKKLEELAEIGKIKLNECPTTEGKKKIRKTNKGLREKLK